MRKFTQYLLLSLLGIFAACAPEEEQPGSGTTPDQPIDESIEIVEPVIPFDAAAEETQTLKIKTNCNWKASVDQNWCHLSETSGTSGESSLDITVDGNGKWLERDARLVLVSENGGVRKILRIAQKHKNSPFLSSRCQVVPANGGSVEVRRRPAEGLQYSIPPVYQELVTEIIESEASVIFKIAPNAGAARRIDIPFSLGTENDVLTIYQEGTEKSEILYCHSTIVTSTMRFVPVDVRLVPDYKVEIPSDCDWCQLDGSLKESSFFNLFTFRQNHTEEIRTVTVTYTSGETKEEFQFIQYPDGVLEASQTDINIDHTAQSIKVSVRSNLSYKVICGEDWIKEAPELRSIQEVEKTFDIEENTTGAVRSGTITIESIPAIIAEEKEIVLVRVTQDAAPDPLRLLIKHTNQEYTVPVFTGDVSSAQVIWNTGDVPVPYRTDLKHTFSGNAPYVTEIAGTELEGFSIPKMTGIIEIDFTSFW